MTKPATFAETMFGAMGLPGFGSAPSGLDPLKGFAIPTIDVEELDRRIADLRSVEGWLQNQATMVRTTIQALEVQRNTVVMVKSFGASMPGGSPFAQAASFFAPAANASAPAAAVAPAWGAPPVPAAEAAEPYDAVAPPAPPPAAPSSPSRTSAPPKSPGAPTSVRTDPLIAAATDAAMSNGTAFWSMLQDQFAKMTGVSRNPAERSGAADKPSSVVGGAKRKPSKAASKAAPKAAPKSASKSTSKSAPRPVGRTASPAVKQSPAKAARRKATRSPG